MKTLKLSNFPPLLRTDTGISPRPLLALLTLMFSIERAKF